MLRVRLCYHNYVIKFKSMEARWLIPSIELYFKQLGDARFGCRFNGQSCWIVGKNDHQVSGNSSSLGSSSLFVNKSWTPRPSSTCCNSTLNSCTAYAYAHWTVWDPGCSSIGSCSPMQLNIIILHELIANSRLNGATYCLHFLWTIKTN